MKSWLISAVAILAGVQLVTAAQTTKVGMEEPSATPVIGNVVVQGCYASAGELTFNHNDTYNTRDACGQVCSGAGFAVGASTARFECFCGNKYPPKSDLVADDHCDNPCPGWGYDACGGFDTYTVYNTGLKIIVDSSDESTKPSSSPSASSPSQTVAVTASDHVVYVTQTGATSGGSSGGGVNAGAVAGGVVVGVVAVVGAIGGFFLFMRRRRNQEIEEEHRRNAAINSFMGSQKPGSSGGLSSSDSRLDPVMAHRRLSDGSIADNQDYSRKILRVTNA